MERNNLLSNFHFFFHSSDCKCITCQFGGGQNQTKEILERKYCVKCSFNEQIHRSFSDYPKVFDSPERCEMDSDKNDTDVDVDVDELWCKNHDYHLSWAVFQHLPCKYNFNRHN